VKKNAWHSHTFSEDARVLMVENRDTVVENSPFVPLSESQCSEAVALTRNFWKQEKEERRRRIIPSSFLFLSKHKYIQSSKPL